MSRSYKKHPYIVNGDMAKFGKKFANKRVRSLTVDEENLKGSSYKKLYEQYDIREFVSYWSWEEALAYYRKHPELYKNCKTEKDFYRYWYKCTKMK